MSRALRVCGGSVAVTGSAWTRRVGVGHPTSTYCGGRTLAWLKVKVPNYREGARGWEAKPSERADTEAGLA